MPPFDPLKLSSVVKVCAAICDADAHSQSADNIREIPDFLAVPSNAARIRVVMTVLVVAD